MGRYRVTIDVGSGPRIESTVRARTAMAAYHEVRSSLIAGGVDPQARCMATVHRRGLRHHRAVMVAGDGSAGDGWDGDGWDGDDGTAGVREPRRPKPAPPSLTIALDVPRAD